MLEFARGATLQAQVTRRRRGVHGAFTHGADGGHQLPPPASKASALRYVTPFLMVRGEENEEGASDLMTCVQNKILKIDCYGLGREQERGLVLDLVGVP